jgi:putative flippase GtrA
MNTKTLKQVVIFVAIGILNTGIDFLVLNILLALVGAPGAGGYIVIKGISFIIANVNSYFWNTKFTFSAKRNVASFGKFFVATAIGFGVNTLVATLVYHLTIGWGILIAGNTGALVGTIASMVINFILYKYVVFKKD